MASVRAIVYREMTKNILNDKMVSKDLYYIYKFTITNNSLVNTFICMATRFDHKPGHHRAMIQELETYTETKSISRRFYIKKYIKNVCKMYK
jgi:hypothetical protein